MGWYQQNRPGGTRWEVERHLKGTTMPFAAKIYGANGSDAHAHGEVDGKVVDLMAPSCHKGAFVRVSSAAKDGYSLGPIALFATREEAREAGRACHWNDQTFQTVVVSTKRGPGRFGLLIKNPSRWVSCQEAGV